MNTNQKVSNFHYINKNDITDKSVKNILEYYNIDYTSLKEGKSKILEKLQTQMSLISKAILTFTYIFNFDWSEAQSLYPFDFLSEDERNQISKFKRKLFPLLEKYIYDDKKKENMTKQLNLTDLLLGLNNILEDIPIFNNLLEIFKEPKLTSIKQIIEKYIAIFGSITSKNALCVNFLQYNHINPRYIDIIYYPINSLLKEETEPIVQELKEIVKDIEAIDNNEFEIQRYIRILTNKMNTIPYNNQPEYIKLYTIFNYMAVFFQIFIDKNPNIVNKDNNDDDINSILRNKEKENMEVKMNKVLEYVKKLEEEKEKSDATINTLQIQLKMYKERDQSQLSEISILKNKLVELEEKVETHLKEIEKEKKKEDELVDKYIYHTTIATQIQKENETMKKVNEIIQADFNVACQRDILKVLIRFCNIAKSYKNNNRIFGVHSYENYVQLFLTIKNKISKTVHQLPKRTIPGQTDNSSTTFDELINDITKSSVADKIDNNTIKEFSDLMESSHLKGIADYDIDDPGLDNKIRIAVKNAIDLKGQ